MHRASAERRAWAICKAQAGSQVDSHLNLVIFGASWCRESRLFMSQAAGDLAKKKTFPSIFQLPEPHRSLTKSFGGTSTV